jgi:glutaminase
LGKTVFAIVRGTASVVLPSDRPGGRNVQLASIGSGLTFGELAIVGGQPRSAQIVADGELVCYAISIAALQAFGRSHPAIYIKVLMNIIRDLADMVQFANETIRALER